MDVKSTRDGAIRWISAPIKILISGFQPRFHDDGEAYTSLQGVNRNILRYRLRMKTKVDRVLMLHEVLDIKLSSTLPLTDVTNQVSRPVA